MSRVLVAGLGNAWRRDDGVGPAVALRIAASNVPGVQVVVNAGEPADLVDVWKDADLAVVVDAMRTGKPAGTHLRIDGSTGDLSAAGTPVSGHVLPLQHVVELARTLGVMPGRLLVFAVEGADFGLGEGLSPKVAATVDRLAREVLDEVAAAGAP